jgi:hypothetical protein
MNEPTPAIGPEELPEAEKPNVVRIALFATLAVMIVALIYEYGFVRRSYKAAENAVDTFVEGRGATDDLATPEVVQAALGKTPVGGLQDKGDYYLEHYQWTRWLPWKTYDIYVVYEHRDPPVLFNTTRPLPPGPTEVPARGVAFDPALLDAPGGDELGDASSDRRERGRPESEDEGNVQASFENDAPITESDAPATAAEGDKPAEESPASESETDSEPSAGGGENAASESSEDQ